MHSQYKAIPGQKAERYFERGAYTQYVSTQNILDNTASGENIRLGDVLDKPHHIASITILIVIPGNDFNESTIQRNTGSSIKNR